MKRQRSPGTGHRYPLTMICRIYRLARSSVYATVSTPALGPPEKRGPKTRVSDAALVAEIRAVLAACPFHGEGYRKVRARLAHGGRAVSGKRVLRLMLAPRRLGPPNGNPAHDGTITTDRPDVMWGTDATRFYTERDGWCWFFGAIDHHLDEVVGWHTAKLGDRWAALEPIRQGVRHAFGRFGKDVARGLAIRCDWGPQYIADAWINEVKWLGCTISPSYVGHLSVRRSIDLYLLGRLPVSLIPSLWSHDWSIRFVTGSKLEPFRAGILRGCGLGRARTRPAARVTKRCSPPTSFTNSSGANTGTAFTPAAMASGKAS